jgi:hypothetical protein
MSKRATGHYTRLAEAIVVAAVVIASGVFASSYFEPTKTITSNAITITSTKTTTQLSATTSDITQTVVTQTTHTQTDTITAVETSTTTTVSTAVQNMTSTVTQIVSTTVPWYGLDFVSAEPGCATEYGQVSYPSPCLSQSNPYVFGCAAEAATSQGCTQQIHVTNTTNQSFNITVWYPYANYNGEQPWQNCKWTQPLPSPPGPTGPYYAYCISINSTSFIIGLQGLPPV